MKRIICTLIVFLLTLPLCSNPAKASLTETEVSQLYVSIFGRASEGDGNSYWQSDPGSTSMTTAANIMLDTDPAKTYFGTTLDDPQAFIEHIYLNTLGKTATEDLAGINYWTRELDGGKTKGEVIAALIVAAQNTANAGTAQDQFNNKVEVSSYCADKIAAYTDLDTFTGFISNVTDDDTTVSTAKNLIDVFSGSVSLSFKLPDTGQTSSYTATFGEDSDYTINPPSFTSNGDGTVSDNVTGLIWQSSPDTDGDGSIDADDKMTQSAAESYCSSLVLANQSDWRLPDIKAMYSLIDFRGEDVSGITDDDTSGATPFIDTNYFSFAYGDTSAGERIIDVQYASTTLYVSTTMNGDETMFGVNLADGRIKGYGITAIGGSEKTFSVQCCRSNDTYGTNSFTDNIDQTISDSATGLMWEKNDSQSTMDWEDAVTQCESCTTGNYTDWRLPNAKELQGIVDYTRSPDTSRSAAINAVFNATSFINEKGETDWGFYWTSTTHKGTNSSENAVYVSFGRALGYMNGQWLDVHGAGAQRSNYKSSSSPLQNSYTIVTDANGNEAITHGPQGDVVRINNYVRCVRD
jgi:Protein of unknown function (DUF1566)/Domain of unknown function (DUF4214)